MQDSIVPNLFVVGIPRAGTTSLHEYLKQHPGIFMSEDKEPWYFATDFNRESAEFHGRESKRFRYSNERDYLRLFENRESESVVGESSVIYIYSQEAAKNIYRFNAKGKIIIILREPVDFLYSLHSFHLVDGVEDIESFEEALGAEEKRRRGFSLPRRVHYPSRLFYSDKVRYHRHIKRFMEYFSADKLKIVLFDDLINSTGRVYREILEFLDVDNTFVADLHVYNARKTARFLYCYKAILKLELYEVFRNRLSHAKYQEIRKLAKKAFLKGSTRKELEPNSRRKLMVRYKEDVMRTSQLVGVDLVKKWNYTSLD